MAQISFELIMKGVTSATDAIKQFSKAAGSSLSKVDSALRNIDLASVAAGTTIGVALAKAINAAEESEKAVTQLNNALKLTGDFSESTSLAFQNFASSLEEAVGVSDEAILQQVAYVKSLGATNEQAEKVTKTALDLSAALGVSLDQAVSSLTATFAGNTGQLGKQIPELKNFTKEQLAAGEAVDFLSKKFAGSAATNVAGFSGQMTKLKLSVDNTFEAFGKLITQQNGGASVVQVLTSAFRGLEQVIIKIPTIGEALEAALEKAANAAKLFGLQLAEGIVSALSKVPLIGEKFEETRKSLGFSVQVAKDYGEVLVQSSKDAEALANKVKKVSDQTAIAKSNAAGLGSSFGKSNDDIEKDFDSIKKQLQNVGLTELQIIKNTERERINAVDLAVHNGVKSAAEGAELRSKIEIDAAKKTEEARKKIVEQFAKDPVMAAIANGGIQDRDQAVATGAGVLGNVLQGSAGATNLVTGAAGAIADSVIPGLGGVVSQIAGVLAQGPEAAKAFINGFVDSLPTVIQAIVDSIPVVIQTLVDRAPDIITALTLAIPKAANTLAIELGLRAPDIARDFAVAFVKEGIPQIVKGFLDEIKKGFDTLNPFGGGGIGGGLGDLQKTISTGGLNKIFGFASGGIVPGNGNVDKVPALLTPGEAMIDTSVSGRLLNFLDSFERDQSQSSRGGTQNLTVNFVMDKQVLASQLIEIDRDGIRTTA